MTEITKLLCPLVPKQSLGTQVGMLCFPSGGGSLEAEVGSDREKKEAGDVAASPA
jgi:hypothetical protein